MIDTGDKSKEFFKGIMANTPKGDIANEINVLVVAIQYPSLKRSLSLYYLESNSH